MFSTVSYVAKQGVLLVKLSVTLYFYLGFGAQTHRQHHWLHLASLKPWRLTVV